MKINITQTSLGGLAVRETIISFIFNDNFFHLRLKDLKDLINEIWNSKGNNNDKTGKAKLRLEQILNELIYIAFKDEKETHESK